MAMGVGKAQQQGLSALGLEAWDHREADDFFRLLGLRVTSRYEGRTFIPVIAVEPRGRTETRGGWVSDEGDEWTAEVGAGQPLFDMTAILPWVTNPDEARAISAAAPGKPAPCRDALKKVLAAEDAEHRAARREYRRRMGF